MEISETVFDVINQEADKLDAKRARNRQRSNQITDDLNSGIPTNSFSTNSFFPSSTVNAGSLSTTDTIDVVASDCIVQGDLLRLGGPFMQTWQRKYLRLFPNRLEFYNKSRDGLIQKKGVEVSFEMFNLFEWVFFNQTEANEKYVAFG